MATFNVSNIVGIDPKPFDPSTYVEENFHVTDASGSKRCIPSTNIIRWRQVTNPDGTTSDESNARFVTWSGGSSQLFIGNDGFDVSERDANEIQSHVFLKHTKGIYQAQGRISRKMKFMPSSLSSNSHRLLTALVDSRHKKVNKVKQYITDADPEREMEKMEKAEKQIIKASKLLNQKRKVAWNYTTKGCKESQLLPGFLEDASNKGPKDPDRSASSIVISTQGTLPFCDDEKAELEHGRKGQEVEGSLSHGKIEKVQEGEEETVFEDFEDDIEEPKAKSKGSGSSLKKRYIESDEDSPPRRITTRRQMAIVYDSNEE